MFEPNKFKIICKDCGNEAYIEEKYSHDGLGNSHDEIVIICNYCNNEENVTEITYSTEY